MPALVTWALVGLLAVAAVAIAVLAYGRVTFARTVDRDMADLRTLALRQEPRRVALDPSAIPAPVARYLRMAGVDGRPWIAHARIRQQGTFRTAPDREWAPTRAEQVFATEPPAMVWSAEIRMPPGLPVRVRDRYFDGVGSMYARLGYFMTVVDASGDAINEGALVRFLSESVWFPSMLSPSPRLTWEPIDDDRAVAVLTDGDVRARGVFHFDGEGRITRFEADRDRAVGDAVSRERWTCHYGDYGDASGWTIPMSGEAEWNLSDGDFSYYRLTISDVAYVAPASNGAERDAAPARTDDV